VPHTELETNKWL